MLLYLNTRLHFACVGFEPVTLAINPPPFAIRARPWGLHEWRFSLVFCQSSKLKVINQLHSLKRLPYFLIAKPFLPNHNFSQWDQILFIYLYLVWWSKRVIHLITLWDFLFMFFLEVVEAGGSFPLLPTDISIWINLPILAQLSNHCTVHPHITNDKFYFYLR